MKLINEKQVREKLPVSRMQLYNLRKEKGFPKPHAVAGMKIKLWREEEVDTWIESNIGDANTVFKGHKNDAA